MTQRRPSEMPKCSPHLPAAARSRRVRNRTINFIHLIVGTEGPRAAPSRLRIQLKRSSLTVRSFYEGIHEPIGCGNCEEDACHSRDGGRNECISLVSLTGLILWW